MKILIIISNSDLCSGSVSGYLHQLIPFFIQIDNYYFEFNSDFCLITNLNLKLKSSLIFKMEINECHN